jgi:hypothetical protein
VVLQKVVLQKVVRASCQRRYCIKTLLNLINLYHCVRAAADVRAFYHEPTW